MREVFAAMGRDWIRAPIANTSGIMLFIAGCACFFRGEIDRGILLWILSELQFMQIPSQQVEEAATPHSERE